MPDEKRTARTKPAGVSKSCAGPPAGGVWRIFPLGSRSARKSTPQHVTESTASPAVSSPMLSMSESELIRSSSSRPAAIAWRERFRGAAAARAGFRLSDGTRWYCATTSTNERPAAGPSARARCSRRRSPWWIAAASSSAAASASPQSAALAAATAERSAWRAASGAPLCACHASSAIWTRLPLSRGSSSSARAAPRRASTPSTMPSPSSASPSSPSSSGRHTSSSGLGRSASEGPPCSVSGGRTAWYDEPTRIAGTRFRSPASLSEEEEASPESEPAASDPSGASESQRESRGAHSCVS